MNREIVGFNHRTIPLGDGDTDQVALIHVESAAPFGRGYLLVGLRMARAREFYRLTESSNSSVAGALLRYALATPVGTF